MSMFQLDRTDLDAEARVLAGRWGWFVAVGAAAVVVGLLLLFNIFEAVATLALLIALALAIDGIDEIVTASRYRPRWPGYLLGAIYIAIAAVTVIWPSITLWVLALVVGIGFIVSGVTQLGALVRFHHDLPYRWVFVLLAVASVVIGILAIAWPEATVVVLAVLFGIRVTVQGISLLAFGFGLRSIDRALA